MPKIYATDPYFWLGRNETGKFFIGTGTPKWFYYGGEIKTWKSCNASFINKRNATQILWLAKLDYKAIKPLQAIRISFKYEPTREDGPTLINAAAPDQCSAWPKGAAALEKMQAEKKNAKE